MKYVVQGSHVKNVYEVVQHNNAEEIHVKKPEFMSIRNDKWEEILSFECGGLNYNTKHKAELWSFSDSSSRINISESEEVEITEQIFRADKATTYLHSDKVLSTTEDKTTNWQAYQDALVEYRDYVFEKYPSVKEYFELYCVKDELENIDKIKDVVLKDKYIQTIHIDKDDIPTNNFGKDVYSILKSCSNCHVDIQDDGMTYIKMI